MRTTLKSAVRPAPTTCAGKPQMSSPWQRQPYQASQSRDWRNKYLLSQTAGSEFIERGHT